MVKEIAKGVVSEVAGNAVDLGFTTIATIAGVPEVVLAKPFAKGLVLGLVENCFNDCAQMTLSVSEKKKLKQVSSMALQTFRELAEQDGVVAWEMDLNLDYFDYAYEVVEHATMEAIKQSERKKVDVLGRYYGKQFYKGNTDWQDMHQMINMIGALTLRQIVLIRLISEGFKGLDNKLFISNPSACIEVNRLKDYGIWQTEGAPFGTNDSWAIQLESIIPTIYSDKVCEVLMLDKLSDNDVERTIDSLKLTAKREPQRVLTIEDYKKHTAWQEFDKNGNLVLDGGGATPIEEQVIRDIVRGK